MCVCVCVCVCVQVVAAMGPPGGARNPVDPRFISLFNVFEIQFPSTDNLRTIYQVLRYTHTHTPQPAIHCPVVCIAGCGVSVINMHAGL